MRTSKKNVGYVAYASSFTSVEEASRRPDAKGVIWHRGAHALEADMEEWVAWQEETIECFSREQLIVNCNPRGEDARKAPPSGSLLHSRTRPVGTSAAHR